MKVKKTKFKGLLIYKKHPKCDVVANDVMKNGILLGCHQGMNIKDLNYICSTFKKFIK